MKHITFELISKIKSIKHLRLWLNIFKRILLFLVENKCLRFETIFELFLDMMLGMFGILEEPYRDD